MGLMKGMLGAHDVNGSGCTHEALALIHISYMDMLVFLLFCGGVRGAH